MRHAGTEYHQECQPGQGEDGTGLTLQHVGDLRAELHKDVLVEPGAEDAQQDGRGNPADDEADDTGRHDECPAPQLAEGVGRVPHGVEQHQEQGCDEVERQGAEPEIHGVQRDEVVTREPGHQNGSHGHEEGHDGDALYAAQSPEFLQKGSGGLNHGKGAGDSRQEEEEEEERAEELPHGHGGKHLRQHVEAQPEGAGPGGGHHPQQGDGGGNNHHAGDTYFHHLVGGVGGEGGQGNIPVFTHIAGVGADGTEADGEGEEDLPGSRNPQLRVQQSVNEGESTDGDFFPGVLCLRALQELLFLFRGGGGGNHVERLAALCHQQGFVRVPHIAQTLVDAAFRVRGIRRAQGEHAYQHDDGSNEQNGHTQLAEPFNTLGYPPEDEVEVAQQGNEEEDGQGALPAEDGTVGIGSHKIAEEAAEFLPLGEREVAHGGVPGVAQRPALQIHVVHGDGQRSQHTCQSQIFPRGGAGYQRKDGGGGVPAHAPASAADGPLHPAERDTQQKKGREVGNHEGAAAVLGGQPGKTKKITEADGAAGHSQHDTEVGVPVFAFGGTAHASLRIIRKSPPPVKANRTGGTG